MNEANRGYDSCVRLRAIVCVRYLCGEEEKSLSGEENESSGTREGPTGDEEQEWVEMQKNPSSCEGRRGGMGRALMEETKREQKAIDALYARTKGVGMRRFQLRNVTHFLQCIGRGSEGACRGSRIKT